MVQTEGTSAAMDLAGRAPLGARLRRFFYRKRHWVGLLFILPWFLSFLYFDVVPFLLNLYLSFTNYSVGPIFGADWVGLTNYIKIFTADDKFVLSIVNTVKYAAIAVPGTLFVSFFIALLLNSKIRGLGIFRTAFYIPSIVPVVATSVIFLFLLSRQGAINQLLGMVGIEPVRWLSRPQWILPSVILLTLWGFGAQMMIFLAGLQGIPNELYEAVEIDGGGPRQKLLNLTIPLMTPTIYFNLLIGIINALQVFASVFILVGSDGGPLNAGLFYMMHIYKNAFRFFTMGYAAALSLILFVVILVLTIIMVRTSDRWVFYSGG